MKYNIFGKAINLRSFVLGTIGEGLTLIRCRTLDTVLWRTALTQRKDCRPPQRTLQPPESPRNLCSLRTLHTAPTTLVSDLPWCGCSDCRLAQCRSIPHRAAIVLIVPKHMQHEQQNAHTRCRQDENLC